MIRLTRLSGSELYLNADLISSVEAHPDTVVTLVDGKHYVVTDAIVDVVAAITRYRATVLALADSLAGSAEDLDVAVEVGPGRTSSTGSGQLYVLRGEKD